ncbi:MAG: hypothetical protein R3B06_23385 [Kofleriaceae bacterium]
MNTIGTLLLAALLVAACGPSGTGDDDLIDAPPSDGVQPPILVPGGGVTSAPLAGALNVYVIEPGGVTPIAGAQVHLGGAGDALQQDATTDATGLASFRDAGLTGGLTVTATAAGRTAATWIGVTGGNVTIPLARRPDSPATARASGTIAGWNNLPAPAFGHYTLGLVTYSFTAEVGAADNRLTQATDGNGAPLNTCVNTGLSNSCAWQLVTRTGPQLHTAVIVDGNAHGTTDPSDDTYTLIGYAAGAPVTLTAGQQLTGESLTMVPAASQTPLTVTFPGAAPGLPTALAIPMLDTGATGQIVFPLPAVTSAQRSTQVLAPSGAFAGSYRLVGLATPSATATAPYSTSFTAVANLASASLPSWLAPPTGLSTSGGTFGFTAPGASVAYANFSTGGSAAWTVTLLDGVHPFRLPAIAPDPLGAGTVTLDVTAADVPGFAASDFRVDEVAASLARASGATTTFTR